MRRKNKSERGCICSSRCRVREVGDVSRVKNLCCEIFTIYKMKGKHKKNKKMILELKLRFSTCYSGKREEEEEEERNGKFENCFISTLEDEEK